MGGIKLDMKFVFNVISLLGAIGWGWYQMELRVQALEIKIENLLSKHIAEEKVEREELAEKVAFYEKELNLNPFSWGKKKKKK